MPRLLALVMIMLTLTGCTAAPAPPLTPAVTAAAPEPAPAVSPAPVAAALDSGPQAPLSAHVERLGYQIKFALAGYTGTTPPTVTIRSITGAVYATNAPATPDGVYILDTVDRSQQVADQMTYTWTTPDGRTLTGEYFYSNPFNTQQWEITRTEHLVLFHAAPLETGEAALLEAAAQRASDFVGVPLPEPHLITYLYPDEASLREQYVSLFPDIMLPPTLSGFGGPAYIYIKGGVPIQEKAVLVSHETVHALGSFHQFAILAEGLTTYTMQLEILHEMRTAGYESPRRQQLFTNLTNLTEIVKVGGFNKVTLEKPVPFEPQERNMYTIGFAFMLFVRSQYGDDGIRKLFALYRQDPDDMTVLSKFFGETTVEVQRLFNLYLARGEALRDARTRFDFPE